MDRESERQSEREAASDEEGGGTAARIVKIDARAIEKYINLL